MSKKRIVYILLAVSLVLNGAFFVAGCNGGLPGMKDLLGENDGAQTENVYSDEADSSEYSKEIRSKLSAIDEIINKYYLNDTEINQQEMLEGIYSGYVNGLGENYTTYYTAEEYTQLMESSSGEYSGIGVSVSQNLNTGIITVVDPFENGPGYEAGMRPEDILYEVEGEEVTGVDINQVVARIKGEEGTTVDLTVYRPSTDEYIDMTVERRMVENPKIEYEMKEDQIGYIKISEFDEVTVDQFLEAVDQLVAQGAAGLIFDLRNNPGGLMESVCEMLDRLLPEGLLVYTMDKDGNKEEQMADDQQSLKIPMVVLVNGNSASASEIFTGALKDYQWATIMGTTTFGKGIVQLVIPMNDGSAVKVTNSKYYTPNGVCIHGEGIAPDIEVEYDSEYEGDNQLDAALTQIREMISEQA